MDRKEYLRIYQLKWIKERRETFFRDKQCENCGSIEELELHHIDPKLKEANSIWSWSEVRRLAEVLKCQVLCKKCHRIETNKQATARRKEHGRGGYNRGCRCEICFKAQQEHNKQRKRKPL